MLLFVYGTFFFEGSIKIYTVIFVRSSPPLSSSRSFTKGPSGLWSSVIVSSSRSGRKVTLDSFTYVRTETGSLGTQNELYREEVDGWVIITFPTTYTVRVRVELYTRVLQRDPRSDPFSLTYFHFRVPTSQKFNHFPYIVVIRDL